MSPNFWKGLRYALGIVLVSYWLPFAYTWFVLQAPWWLVVLVAFTALGMMIQLEIRRNARH